MGKFYVHITGTGEGCDYTMGCNNTLIKLVADNKEQAQGEVEEMLRETFSFNGDMGYRASAVLILEDTFSYQPLNSTSLNDFYKIEEECHNDSINLIQEEMDRKEFERLKRKLNK